MRSMTGYGQAVWRRGGRSLTVELRAVNQRFLEVKLNMPREYLPWEAEVRAAVQEQVARGKVDVSIVRGGQGISQFAVETNIPLASAYVDAWRQLQHTLRVTGDLDFGALLGRNEFLRVVERRSDASGELPALRATVRRAVLAFNREREREGRVLGRDMTARLRRLQQLQRQIQQRTEVLAPELAARLRQRVSALLNGRELSEERLLQE